MKQSSARRLKARRLSGLAAGAIEPLLNLVAQTQGGSRVTFASLDEARRQPDAAVVLRGDFGSCVYVVVPARHITCTQPALRQLLHDVDALCWQEPQGAGLHLERLPVGSKVGGGVGGRGEVIDGVWTCRRLRKWALSIGAVLAGERKRIARRSKSVGKTARRHFDASK